MTVTLPPTEIVANRPDLNGYRLIAECYADERGNVFEASSAIHPTAMLGRGNRIAPFAVVGADVRLGDDNMVEPFAIVGSLPQIRAPSGSGGLEVGDGNVFHTHSTISRGSVRATRIGDRSIFMASSHVGHDSVVGSRVTLGNHATLAGHVFVDDGAIVGAFAIVIQHACLGTLSHVLPQLACRRSLVPAETFAGDGRPRVNTIGVRRAGGTANDIRAIRRKMAVPFARLEEGPGWSRWPREALRRWDAQVGVGPREPTADL